MITLSSQANLMQIYANGATTLRKPTTCISETKMLISYAVTAQICSYCTADLHFCFHYNVSSSYILNFKLLAIFCGCTGRFLSDLFGTTNCFSHAAAHINKLTLYHLEQVLQLKWHNSVERLVSFHLLPTPATL